MSVAEKRRAKQRVKLRDKRGRFQTNGRTWYFIPHNFNINDGLGAGLYLAPLQLDAGITFGGGDRLFVRTLEPLSQEHTTF